MQLVDTEFREIQDAVRENERIATETTLKLKQLEGATAGLLARAAGVGKMPDPFASQPCQTTHRLPVPPRQGTGLI